MIKEIKRISNGLYIDGDSFASDIMEGCIIKDSNIILGSNWLTFDDGNTDKCIGEKIKEIVEYIIELRKQHDDENAIEISDAFFQSFTPLVRVLEEQNNFRQITAMWNWLISEVTSIEKEKGIEFGKGVHKGTAFYFLGIARLIMGDVDGAYLWFSEAAEEDKTLGDYRDRWEKGLSPAEKILALDLSPDNYGYNFVKHIREKIETRWRKHPEIIRPTSVFTSIENAIKTRKRDEIYPICYAFTKAVFLDTQRESIRSTYLAVTQMCETILIFARALEDFIRSSKDFEEWLTNGGNNKMFVYCRDEWFSGNRNLWQSVKNYDNDVGDLIDDFLKKELHSSEGEVVEFPNNDELNLIFTLKLRNALTHRIQTDPKIFENYSEIIVAISSSFGFVCDKISSTS